MQQFQNFTRRLCVEVARRFVSDKQCWICHDGPRDRHALFLTARQLPGVVIHPVLQADNLEGRFDVVVALTTRQRCQRQGEFDILVGRQHGDEIVHLKDESHVP